MSSFREIFAKADADILKRVGDEALLDGESVKGELVTEVRQAGFHGMTGLQGLFFRIPEASATTAARGSELVFGATYSVLEVIPDEGMGVVYLSLRREQA